VSLSINYTTRQQNFNANLNFDFVCNYYYYNLILLIIKYIIINTLYLLLLRRQSIKNQYQIIYIYITINLTNHFKTWFMSE
jgi:hypothetical protein